MNLEFQEIATSDDIDVFDRLPDEVVRLVFNKLRDARSLTSSMAVCKRFQTLATQVDEIALQIPHKRPQPVKPIVDHEQTPKNPLKNLFTKTLIKPLQFISQLIRFKSKDDDESDSISYHAPNDVLKPFQEIRALQLTLPCNGSSRLGSKKRNFNTFLKWKAEFGRELHSCVILGANSRSKMMPETSNKNGLGEESRVMSDGELKLRIVWTISCLIAASARHYLVQDTIRSRGGIESVVVTDESSQGRLSMSREQIGELTGLSKVGGEGLEYRSKLPALRMKMWYLERLELADSGEVMEGATIVVIRPADAKDVAMSDGEIAARAFGGEDKAVCEAVTELMVAKRCYTMEMNSF